MAKSRNKRKGKKRKHSYLPRRNNDWDIQPPTAYITSLDNYKTEVADQQLREEHTFLTF